MYDELVKRLRRYVEIERSEHHGAELEAEAADAIEELSHRATEWKAIAKSWRKVCEGLESRMPRWIPVTERLPEEKRASYLCRTEGGYCKEVRWTNILYGLVESDNWGWCIFDIPQFSHVTHWMPLPEPPKEEESNV